MLCTCTTCLLLSDTLLHTGKAETTSLDETGDDLVLSEQEATEYKNKQDTTLGSPQEEDLGVGDNIDTLTEAVNEMSVGGGASTSNNTFSMDLSFPYLLYNYEAKDKKVATINFLWFWKEKNVSPPCHGCTECVGAWGQYPCRYGLRKLIPTLHIRPQG